MSDHRRALTGNKKDASRKHKLEEERPALAETSKTAEQNMQSEVDDAFTRRLEAADDHVTSAPSTSKRAAPKDSDFIRKFLQMK